MRKQVSKRHHSDSPHLLSAMRTPTCPLAILVSLATAARSPLPVGSAKKSDCSWTLSNCRPIIFGSFSSPSNGVVSPTSAFIDGIEISTSYREIGKKVGTRWTLDATLRVEGLLGPSRTKSTSSRNSSRHRTFLLSTRCSPSLCRNMQTLLVSRLKALSSLNTSVIELWGSVDSVVGGSPTLEESNLRKKGGDPRTDQT